MTNRPDAGSIHVVSWRQIGEIGSGEVIHISWGMNKRRQASCRRGSGTPGGGLRPASSGAANRALRISREPQTPFDDTPSHTSVQRQPNRSRRIVKR